MKVLMISDLHTHPQNMGNRQRVYSICVMMKKLGWDIDFLYFGNKKECDWDAMKEFFGKDKLFFAERGMYSLKSSIRAELRKKVDSRGFSKLFPLKHLEDEWYCNDVDNAIYLHTKNKKYDIVWIPYLFQSRSLDLFDEELRVIESQDRFGNRDKIFRRVGKKPEFFYTTCAGEKKALSRADVVVTIQDKEEKIFKEMLKRTKTKVCSIGNAIDFHETMFFSQKIFGFIGSANGPNIMAIEWFIKEILPLVKAKVPEVEFVIAGAICNRIPDSSGYTKLGYVESLQEFYEGIRFAITPMLNGTGLNIKSIEALAYSKPLVTTTVGAKGLERAKGAMIIDDNPERIADNIVCLLQDDELCQKMMVAAKKFVTTYNMESEKKLLEIGSLATNKERI